MIYLLTAIGLSPGGSSTVHIYTQTIHRTTQNRQYIEQYNNWRNISTIYTHTHTYIYIYKTRPTSHEIFSPSNTLHREVGRAKDLSAPRYHTIRR